MAARVRERFAGPAAVTAPFGPCSGQAGDGEAAWHVEVGHLGEGEPGARAVPVEDAVVEPEDRAREQARIRFGYRPLLHPAGQERRPLELEVARSLARELPRLLLARGRPMHADEHLLGDQQAVAQDLALGEVERRLQHGGERLREVLVLAGDALEPLHLGREGLGHDLVETVELGLEVVIQRGRADAQGRGDVRPLAVLVALAAEQLGRGVEDRRSLAARRRGTAVVGASVARLAWLRHGFLRRK